jgi:hypothetical protein
MTKRTTNGDKAMSTTLPPVSTTLPPAPTIPRVRDPIALAGYTVEAVDQIGASAAAEIEKSAEAIESGAHEIAEKLRALARAMREHSQIAGEHVTEFCEKSTSVIETVRELKVRIDGKAGLDVPKFINGEDHAQP